MDRYLDYGDALGDKYYDAIQERMQEEIQERIEDLLRRKANWILRNALIDRLQTDKSINLWVVFDCYQDDILGEIEEIQRYYDDDDFEAMDSYLFGLKKERKKWKQNAKNNKFN